MAKKYDFDYIIIGSGPAGTSATLGLSKSRKKIALVDGGPFGGSRIYARNIPYTVALNFAETYSKIATYPEFGPETLSFSFPTLVSRQLKTIAKVSNHSIYDKPNLTLIPGYANFLDPHTIAVGESQYTSHFFILATGSELKTTEISGLDSVNYLTPTTAIRTRRLPKAVFVVGAGSTGCEIAEYFANLGTKVLIADTSERILPREDKEVGSTISDYFSTELDITVLPNCRVVALEQDSLSKKVIFSTAHTEKMVRVDCIVLATGSKPVVDYGLENAGVKYQSTGIKINKHFETSAKHIFAIGDCVDSNASTERAEYEGDLLASNLVNKVKNPANYTGFIRITNTYPEIATVGLNEDDLLRRDRKYKKSLVYLNDTIPGKTRDLDYGFIKLLADKRNNRILGACIVSPHAGLIAEELSLAIRYNLTISEVASTPHLSDDLNFAVKLAARDLILKKK